MQNPTCGSVMQGVHQGKKFSPELFDSMTLSPSRLIAVSGFSDGSTVVFAKCRFRERANSDSRVVSWTL